MKARPVFWIFLSVAVVWVAGHSFIQRIRPHVSLQQTVQASSLVVEPDWCKNTCETVGNTRCYEDQEICKRLFWVAGVGKEGCSRRTIERYPLLLLQYRCIIDAGGPQIAEGGLIEPPRCSFTCYSR